MIKARLLGRQLRMFDISYSLPLPLHVQPIAIIKEQDNTL